MLMDNLYYKLDKVGGDGLTFMKVCFFNWEMERKRFQIRPILRGGKGGNSIQNCFFMDMISSPLHWPTHRPVDPNATCTHHVIAFWLEHNKWPQHFMNDHVKWGDVGHDGLNLECVFSIEKREPESFMVGILACCFLKSALQNGKGRPKLSFMGRLSQILHVHTTSTNLPLSNFNSWMDLNILCILTQEATILKRCGIGRMWGTMDQT